MLITKFLHNCLNEALQKLINEQNITNFNPPEYVVEKPKNKNHGDYATNLPMQLAKIFKENPINIANKIKDNIDEHWCFLFFLFDLGKAVSTCMKDCFASCAFF